MTSAKTVTDALTSRLSVRDFLPAPVPAEVIRQVLATAARSPSGGNLQPWHIDVVAGESLAALKAIAAQKVAAAAAGDTSEQPEYDIYPKELVSPYRDYRFELGEDMYATMGIPRTDMPPACAGLPATSSSSAPPWRCFVPSTAGWARPSGVIWACSCNR